MSTFGFQWHLTDRCNARCRHCYQNDFSDAADLPLADVLTVADNIFGSLPHAQVSLNLTGGEPLLWPHLLILLEHLSKKPNFAEASVITNATIADAALLGALGEFEQLRMFKISVESGDEAVNDAIRGAGSLKRTLRHLPLYQRHRPVVWMMTLGAHNAPTIATTTALARAHGVSGIIFERFVPLGQGRAAPGLVLDARGWRQAVVSILEQADVDAEPEDLAAHRAFWLWTEPGHDEPLQGALCNLGDESMALLPDATVCPCRRLPIPLGNALREPFADIRERLAEYTVESLRSRLHGGLCGLCGEDACGGCRALARALTGDILEDDPQCVLACDDK